MMKRLLGATAALALVSGCGGATDTSPDTTQSALSNAGATPSADGKAALEGCLSTFATCVRAGTEATCGDALRACLPKPPPPRHRGDGDGDGDGDRDGDCHDDGPPPPPPPPDGPRPADGPDGDRPPPPPPPPPPCIGELEACAKGSEAIETCVSNALACVASVAPDRRR